MAKEPVRRNATVRMDISRQGPAREMAPRAVPTASMGQVLAGMFPQTAANVAASEADAAAAYNRGEVLRAIGASSRKLVSAPAGLAYDLTVPVIRGLGGVAAGLGGGFLAGASDDTVTKAAPAKASAAAAKPERGQRISGAPATVHAPMREPTVHEVALAAIDNILTRPHTMRQFNEATGALPGVSQATAALTKSAPKMTDVLLGQVMEQSGSVLSSDLARIEDERVKGEINDIEARKKSQQAQMERYQRDASLHGANPVQYIEAQMLANAQRQQEQQ